MTLESKKRQWAEAISIDSRWKSNGRLARHRPYFFYEDDELFPCDERGFRIPSGFSSLRDKAVAAGDQKTVFCYGGSTTFGVYCRYEDSYPHRMEEILGRPCFNMGLQSLDLYGSLLNFTDHLRDGLVPGVAVFLDGANENQGYVQAVSDDYDRYRPEFRQYAGFRDIILNTSLAHRFRRLFSRPAPPSAAANQAFFTDEHAAEYVKSQRAIRRLGEAYGVRTVFLLQPTVWDIWGDGSDPRYKYMKDLYARIVECTGGDVADISGEVPMDPDWFIDWAHLREAGNQALAERIARAVTEHAT